MIVFNAARCRLALWALSCLAYPLLGAAHEIRPAYLEINQCNDPHIVQVTWKQPSAGAATSLLAPRLSSGWLDPARSVITSTASSQIARWNVVAPAIPLYDQRLVIDGLEHTLSDVMVHICFGNHGTLTTLLTPEHPSLQLREPGVSNLTSSAYFQLGVTHILSGADHLLYIFALMLLVTGLRRLFVTITAFTAAHSITLAATALHLIRVDTALIELLIALSIVYVAVEAVYARMGRHGIAARFPWMIAFVFGLLHGFGFAGALMDIGLPRDAIPAALFLFNLGIETGQLAFVLAMVGAARALQRYCPRALIVVPRISPHLIGTIASFWCYQRALQLF